MLFFLRTKTWAERKQEEQKGQKKKEEEEEQQQAKVSKTTIFFLWRTSSSFDLANSSSWRPPCKQSLVSNVSNQPNEIPPKKSSNFSEENKLWDGVISRFFGVEKTIKSPSQPGGSIPAEKLSRW